MDPTITNTPLVSYMYEEKDIATILPPLPTNVDMQKNTFRKSVFQHNGAIKLANLDAVTKITGHIRSFVNPQFTEDENEYLFLDLCSGKGGFSEYVIYRRAYSKGTGISLGNENEYDGTSNYVASTGTYGDGDLLADPEDLITFILHRFPRFHLVMADGVVDEQPIGFQYFHLPTSVDVSAPNQDSNVTLYSPHPLGYTQLDLLKAELEIAFRTIQPGGTLVVRLSNPTNWKEGALIYEASRYFDEMYMFRPVTADEGEMYVIGKGFRQMEENEDTNMSTMFVQWFSDCATQARKFIPVNNVDKCYIQWGLPSGSFETKMTPKVDLAYGNFQAWREGKNLSELYTFTFKSAIPHSLKEGKVVLHNQLYEITTMRGTKVTLSKVRVDAYAKMVSWEYLFDVIDWYVPFGFVGFCSVDNVLIDLFANPFTRGSKRWTSYYHEQGSEPLDKNKQYQAYLPPIKECLDRMNELNVRAIVYVPYWPSHPLFKRLRNVQFEMPCLWNYATSEKYITNVPYIRADFA